jgi:hypothetical protein
MRLVKLSLAVACLGSATIRAQAPVAEPLAITPPARMSPAPAGDLSPLTAMSGQLPDHGPVMGSTMGEPGRPIYGGGDPNALPPIPESWLNSAFNPQPKIEGRAGVVFWKPTFDQSPALGSQIRSNGTGGLVDQQFVLRSTSEYVAAPTLDFKWHCNEFCSIETGGWFMDGPRNRSFLVGPADFFIRLNQLNGFPGTFPMIADQGVVDWDFKSYSWDINMVRHYIYPKGPISDFALGVGFRYIGIYESVEARFTDEISAVATNGMMRVNADNSLFGGQFLARARVQSPWKKVRMLAETKIALNYNPADVSSRVEASGGAFGQNSSVLSLFSPTFEGNFTVEYFVTPNLTVYGGFNMFFAERVMRASEQFSPNFDNFLNKQQSYGSLYMFGPTAGLVLNY